MKKPSLVSRLAFLGLAFFVSTSSWGGEVLAVAPPKNAPANAAPTMTLLYGVDNAVATLIAIPGGEGRIGLKETTTSIRNQTALMLETLTRSNSAASRLNIVVFDSPYEIYPYALRRSDDHLDRIESVVRFYKDKFNKPVWLLGHSWGSVSVTEFVNKPNNKALLSGLITSGSKYEIEIRNDINLPVLFLHHEQDGCRATPYSYALKNYEKAKTFNKGVTELATVKGGQARGDPCRDGRHMFFGAYEEAAHFIDQFISRNRI